MREILFRGKANNGKWAYGVPVPVTINCYVKGVEIIDEEGIEYDELDDYNPVFGAERVDPETVGQFTGLTDKNGTKIFEGDVIQFHKYRGEPDWVGVVKYEHCLYMAVGTMPLAYEKRIGEEPYYCPFEVQISGIDKTTIKVIGNIHDNPELLKVGAEDG